MAIFTFTMPTISCPKQQTVHSNFAVRCSKIFWANHLNIIKCYSPLRKAVYRWKFLLSLRRHTRRLRGSGGIWRASKTTYLTNVLQHKYCGFQRLRSFVRTRHTLQCTQYTLAPAELTSCGLGTTCIS